MKNKQLQCFALLALMAALLTGCAEPAPAPEAPSETAAAPTAAETEPGGLRDSEELYRNEDPYAVTTMYLTICPGMGEDGTYHTWTEINTHSLFDYQAMGVEPYQVAGFLQVGADSGQAMTPNVTVRAAGTYSTENEQKDYLIDKSLGRGQSVVLLNKYQGDGLRFGSKMMLDLMKEIPQLMSLRTQFIHLYVKDETDGLNLPYQDYGLYTQVEQMHKTDLWNHGLDPDGDLYGLNGFEFFPFEGTGFGSLVEERGTPGREKFLKMLTAVNDHSLPVDKLLDTFFDRENLTYWLAMNILMGNTEARSGGACLYSPSDGQKWYFLTADDPETVLPNGQGAGWETGVSNFWGNALFQRCLRSDTFRAELDQAVQDLRMRLTRETLEPRIRAYCKTVKPYLYRVPDLTNAVLEEGDYEKTADGILDILEQNYQNYLASLEKPMPFYIGAPEVRDGMLHVEWDMSFDFRAQDVTFTLELAKDSKFQTMITRAEGIRIPEASLDLPPAGTYFLRIFAQDASGNIQEAFDLYETTEEKVYGTKMITVTPEGTVREEK